MGRNNCAVQLSLFGCGCDGDCGAKEEEEEEDDDDDDDDDDLTTCGNAAVCIVNM